MTAVKGLKHKRAKKFHFGFGRRLSEGERDIEEVLNDIKVAANENPKVAQLVNELRPLIRDSLRIQELKRVILSAKPGEILELIWIDASQCKNRRICDLTNREFATYKRTLGWFSAPECSLRYDHRYNQPHIVTFAEQTGEDEIDTRHDIDSSPLLFIMRINRLSEKIAKKVQKGATLDLRVPITTVKIKRAVVTQLDHFGEKIILHKEVKE